MRPIFPNTELKQAIAHDMKIGVARPDSMGCEISYIMMWDGERWNKSIAIIHDHYLFQGSDVKLSTPQLTMGFAIRFGRINIRKSFKILGNILKAEHPSFRGYVSMDVLDDGITEPSFIDIRTDDQFTAVDYDSISFVNGTDGTQTRDWVVGITVHGFSFPTFTGQTAYVTEHNKSMWDAWGSLYSKLLDGFPSAYYRCDGFEGMRTLHEGLFK